MRIKIVCLNLWIGGKLIEEVIKFLQKERPDILALQEVYDGKDPKLGKRFRSLEVLKQELDLPHEFFSPALLDIRAEGRMEQGNAIFSKFPFLKTDTIFYDVPFGERTRAEGPGDFTRTPRNLQHVLIEAGKTKLDVFNTQGIWGFDGKDNERRLKMSEKIIENIKGKENIILCGDLNVDQRTETIYKIEKHLKNIFKGELETSFNMKQKTDPRFASATVDFIFASNNLNILDHYCPDADVSDHLPLVGVFEI